MPFLPSTSESETIVGIQFGIFSPDEIIRRSVVEITNHNTQEGKIGGLFDPRMGVLENGKNCRSCFQNNHKCQGHWGYYRLARPVYYIQFFKLVLKVLRCCCLKCGKLLIEKNKHLNLLKLKGEARWKQALIACQKISRCGEETEDGCGARQPRNYTEEDICKIYAEWKDMEIPVEQELPEGAKETGTIGDAKEGKVTARLVTLRKFLEPEYVHRLLKRITDEDVDFMGFSRYWCRPDWMMCSVLAIPPPQVRPSVLQDNNQRSEDDLTQKLVDIIKTNTLLADKISKNIKKKVIDEWTNVLQYHIATFINNEIPGIAPSAQRSGRPLKSVQQRLGSKEGRIRNNLQGKRVEHSARTVITPDPNLSIKEIGVPIKIASNLTYPERVTVFNIDKLYKLIQNGPDVYPGAKTIVRSSDNRMISLKHISGKDLQLFEGDIVNRHLMDGDYVLFNRQPSLHRMSMMGHQVRVLPYNTFRLNVSVTAPYNADFDGDEMNLHAPQSEEAAMELREIAAVPLQIVSPRDSKPIVSVVQDTLVGVNRFMRSTVKLTMSEVMNMLAFAPNWSGALPPPSETERGQKWLGRQVVSVLLPPLNLEMPNGQYDEEKDKGNLETPNFVRIRNGEIQQGVFDKTIFSSALIHLIYNDYGADTTVRFLDSLQRIVANYLINSGFSVGLSDLIADENTRKEIDKLMGELKSKIENIIQQVHLGLFDNASGRSNQDEFERLIFGELNQVVNTAGKLGRNSLADNNRMTNMIKAGSKGSNTNVAQMIAVLGQQNVEGKRIPYGLQDRTLPHFKRYDDGAASRGFIESSFIKGLTPAETFFHAMSGREGLIDTAVKSVTGDTPIIVLEDGKAKRVLIGDWIDTQLAASFAKVEHFEQRNLELLQLSKPVFIPTTDGDGKVTWGDITAITRHDPGDQLYEIKTLGGKSVIVTESKALLVWNATTKQFEQKPTPDVVPGDYVPVTMNLAAAPITVDTVKMSDYLPKDTYLYGTDFHQACHLMKEAMGSRDKIPVGWWEENNGKTFTLPYNSKAKLQRMLVRSNTENIKPGSIYPFTTNRSHAMIPDTFALNNDNGIMIGLFLAEGNVDVKSGYVQITNKSVAIREFVKEWFENQRIEYSENVRINHICATSTDIRGFSTILAKFMDIFVGHGAQNKRIPDEALLAPEEFVLGLLNGYFSGDGTVSKNSIECGSASSELIDGISMLCTRIGVFGKVFKTHLQSNNFGTETILPTYRLSIRANWATRFAEKIQFLDEAKEEKRKVLKCSATHRNFSYQNDCVLDEIVEINIIDTTKYPKVYDLTVPSTVNFGLANGLHVVDTADTGYLQRQLVKAMEDLMTHHDKTVRDAAGTIIQFSYGEDGTNSTKIEYQPLPLSDLSDEQINAQFAVADAGADGEAFVAQIKADRKMLVEGVMGGKPLGNNVAGPVHLPRTVKNIVLQLNLSKEEPNKVTGGQVLAMIQSILERTMPSNKIWGALLRFHLNPRTIQRKGFTQAALEVLATQIINRNWFSWCLPGEMVGIIAAQSIGEPSTQMSTHKSTLIHVVSNANGEHYIGPIGPFVDRYFKTTDTGSVVLDLTENNGFKIVGVSNDEKTSWRSISQISRHPANGGLVQVITKSGRKTTATLSHSFLKRGYILPEMRTGVVPVLGSDLKVGMRIPIARSIPSFAETKTDIAIGTNMVTLDKEFGWLCGMYLADGSFNGNTVQIAKIHPLVEVILQKISTKYGWDFSTKYHDGEFGSSKDNNIYCKELMMFLLENFGTGSYDKTLSGNVFSYPRNFQQGLLGGYFDGDGNVNVENQLIRVGSRSEELIRSINRLFGYCGFFTILGQETSVASTNKIMYTLGVMKKDATKFKQEIGFALTEKAAALEQIIEYNNRSDIHDTKDVYDKIPELGLLIAETGKLLRMPGQSRNYGRWIKKESIGRRTLATYIEDFKEQLENLQNQLDTVTLVRITLNLNELESAVHADVVWDEIVELVYLDDPKEYVYDFTVPGNDSFMVDDCIMVHNTLNTFHLAGVASKSAVTRGIPRLKELLKATRNPKASSLTIFLRQELRKSKEAARRVAQELEFTLLMDLVRVARIYFDPRDETTVVTQDQEWLSFFRAYETVSAEVTETQGQADAPKAKQSPWILRLELDRDKMFLKNITMEDVLYVVNRRFTNIVTSYTDYNADELVVRIRLELENDPMDDLLALKKLQNNLLSNSLVRGITGLKSVTFSVMKDCFEFTGSKYERVEQFVLDTDGTNFLDVLCHPDVDPHKLYSNNIHDIYANLGVEATRAVLLREISSLFEDNNVNYRHFGLLCDVICSKGKLMTVDRYGINKNNIGPLAKASFEQTEDIMLRAALFGELDPITGVSANIMTGQPIRGGTSFSSILLDEDALKKFMGEMTDGAIGNEIEKEDEFTEEDEETTLYEARTASGKDDPCSLPRLRLEASIPTQKEVATEYSDMEITLI